MTPSRPREEQSELARRYIDLTLSFITTLELRNPYNVDHCRLVARLCEQMAKRAGLDSAQRKRLIRAAETHTLGVSLQMEEKRPYFHLPITRLGLTSGREAPSHLREEQILTEVLGPVPELRECIPIILQRNEWFDGSASLFGGRGDELSEEARLLAVADAFIDLATPKKHRAQETSREALQRILERSGSQFDPRYVEALKEVLHDEDGSFSESGRTEHFETARCRHYLSLGHLYIAIHETDWALRSYIKAERVAVEMADSGLELGAISGQVMVYCDLGFLEQAREALQRARQRTHSEREKRGYHLMWGLVEWLSGREQNGFEILERLHSHYRKARNLPGLTASLILQSYLLLTHRGLADEEHAETLQEFLRLVAQYDLFDVVERYRSFTLPLFLSAVLKGVEEPTARANLTKMGEPCQQALLARLADIAPARWMDHLRPEPVVPTATAPMPELGEGEQTDGGAAIRLATLGGFRLESASGSVTEDEWPTQKAMRLFAYLAVTRAAVTDDFLMEAFWPDTPESKARNSLRNAIHQARSMLKKIDDRPPAKLLVRGRKSGTAKLDFEYRLDTERLEEHTRRSAEALAGGRPEEAVREAKLALDLYRGEFLEGFHDGWVENLRVQFRDLQQRALSALAWAYLEAERYEEAELAARRMLALDDLREDGHEVVIRALAADGRSAEAIGHYEEAVDLFEAEIGVAPGALKRVLQEAGLLL